MTKKLLPKYIVYAHYKKTNDEIFYIGISKTKKRKTSKDNRNKFWHRTVNKHGFYAKILFSELTEKQAKEKEKSLIKFYGKKIYRSGCLVNLTDGGDGKLGHTPSKETIEKIRISNTGKKIPYQQRVKISNSLKGRYFSKEHRAKIGAAHKNRIFSKETLLKMSKSQKGNQNFLGKKHTEETKLKISLAKRGTKLSEETKQKMSLTRKGRIPWNKGIKMKNKRMMLSSNSVAL